LTRRTRPIERGEGAVFVPQKGMASVRVGVSPHDLALRINTCGGRPNRTRHIKRDKRTVSLPQKAMATVRVAVRARDLALRINALGLREN
jgi:hypothetical protein